MFCSKCGRKIDDDSMYCPICGQRTGASASGMGSQENGASRAGGGGRRSMAPGMARGLNPRLIAGITAGIVVLAGESLGAMGLTAGLGHRKEATQVAVSEAAESTGARKDKEVQDQKEETVSETSTGPAPGVQKTQESPNKGKGKLYVIDPYTLGRRELHDFFQLHLGCYVDYVFGNEKTEPVNISSMLKHTRVMGAVILDEDMRVVRDYNDALFGLGMTASELPSAMFGESQVNYSCSVNIKEVNFEDSFKYYAGTDAQICIIAQLDYFINDREVSFYNDHVVVLLENEAGNPEEWLIRSAIFISQLDYERANGNYFKSLLENENIEADEFQGEEWKQAYLDYLETVNDFSMVEGFALEDINGDQIPELYLRSMITAFGGSRLYYFLDDGTIDCIYGAGGYAGDKLKGSSSSNEIDYVYSNWEYIYQRDANGKYVEIFQGKWLEDMLTSENSFWIGDKEYTEQEFWKKYDSVWGPEEANWYKVDEDVSDSSVVLDAIMNY